MYLPNDRVGRRTFKYALTIVYVASRYKEAKAITDKTATHVGKALECIYARRPVRRPKVLQIEPGSEFRGAVQKACDKNGVTIRRGEDGVHRDQGIVERFNRTFAEKLLAYQYHRELAEPGTSNREWVSRLTEVVKALNNETTRLTGRKPSL